MTTVKPLFYYFFSFYFLTRRRQIYERLDHKQPLLQIVFLSKVIKQEGNALSEATIKPLFHWGGGGSCCSLFGGGKATYHEAPISKWFSVFYFLRGWGKVRERLP